jgi:hypothetical protein
MRILSVQPKLIVDILLQWIHRGHFAVTCNKIRSEIVNTAYFSRTASLNTPRPPAWLASTSSRSQSSLLQTICELYVLQQQSIERCLSNYGKGRKTDSV